VRRQRASAGVGSTSWGSPVRTRWVRFVDGIHFFARERREEVRLLGY
jgi:hypothetical protein